MAKLFTEDELKKVKTHRNELLTDLTSRSCLGEVTVRSTLKTGPNISELHKTGHYFKASPILVACRPFSIESTTITSGTYKGHQALVLVPVPAQHFRFLDLPPEIRNMVYKELLTRPGYDIVLDGVKKDALSRMWSRPGDAPPKKCSRKASEVQTSIFGTCKQIHTESATISYSESRFCVRNITALRSLLHKLGPSHKQIRAILIYGGTDCTTSFNVSLEVYGILTEMTNLRTLEVRCNDMHDVSIRRLLLGLSDCFHGFCRMYNSSNSVSDRIRFIQDKPCSSCAPWYKSECHDCLSANVTFYSHLPLLKQHVVDTVAWIKRKREEQRNKRLQRQADLIAKKEAELAKLKRAI